MGIRLRNNVYPANPLIILYNEQEFHRNLPLTTTGLNGCSHTVTQTDYIQIQPPTASISPIAVGGCRCPILLDL